jgi:small subunit ribosomal protein S2
VIAGVLGRAGEEGQRKRLEAAKSGEVTWLPPRGLGKPDTGDERAKKGIAKGKAEVKSKAEDNKRELESIKKRAKFTLSEEEDL